MVIPEHAEVSDTDRGHERADHLVELARSSTEDASECWIAHVEERFYRGLRRRVAWSLVLSLVCRRRLEPPLTSILEVA